jgi:alpha-methylacyl-CoA racemase
MPGPLEGIRIVEIAGIGPGPFCGMMLADHGAEVIRVDRAGQKQSGIGADPGKDPLQRSRRSIALDLKKPDGIAVVRDLCRTADGLIEGFRPGVMERLGLGPDLLIGDNPRLVYGRMTGWGQTGPYAQAAGHDINYVALAGALHAFGRAGEKPTPPINMVGDFGGGGMLLAFGMVSALLAAQRTGRGQVIDCAMVDGSALLMSMIWGFRGQGLWRDERGVNLLDTGAHFYDTYECADGRYVSIGSIEPQFYAELRRLAGLEADAEFDRQMDPRSWPPLKDKLAALFKSRTRAEWCAAMEQSDVCFAPVLSMGEAPGHPHNAARGIFADVGGVTQPMPAPRYSETATAEPRAATEPGADGEAVLASIGYDAARIAELKAGAVLG